MLKHSRMKRGAAENEISAPHTGKEKRNPFKNATVCLTHIALFTGTTFILSSANSFVLSDGFDQFLKPRAFFKFSSGLSLQTLTP